MKKVELTQAEVAVLSDLTGREIERTAREKHEEQRECMCILPQGIPPVKSQTAALGYYRERLRMLRQLKAKLEREEE